MSASGEVFRQGVACVLLGTLFVVAPLEVRAQSCARGYYYASDGNCYPGPPPNYPPPAYDATPPAAVPPIVADGLMIGLGMLLGNALSDDHGGRQQEYRAPPRRGQPQGNRQNERGHR